MEMGEHPAERERLTKPAVCANCGDTIPAGRTAYRCDMCRKFVCRRCLSLLEDCDICRTCYDKHPELDFIYM